MPAIVGFLFYFTSVLHWFSNVRGVLGAQAFANTKIDCFWRMFILLRAARGVACYFIDSVKKNPKSVGTNEY